MPRRAPFMVEGFVVLSFLMGMCVGGLWAGCAASTLEAKAADVVTIEGKDLACLLANAAESDATIVSRCSPAGDQAKAETIQVYLAICHAHASKDAGPDASEGNLWTTRNSRLASSLPVWPARSARWP